MDEVREEARALEPPESSEQKPPKPEKNEERPPKKPKRVTRPSVSPKIRARMLSEARNEYNVLRDSRGFATIVKDEWLKERVGEKIEAYHNDPNIKEAYDNWGLHHGGTKKGE